MHGARTSRDEVCPFPSTSMAVKRARVSTACCQRQLASIAMVVYPRTYFLLYGYLTYGFTNI